MRGSRLQVPGAQSQHDSRSRRRRNSQCGADVSEGAARMKAYTQIPPGTQILIGRAARRRRVLERAICSVFEGWSYEEIIPPIFDYYDVFAKGMGMGPEEQIYRFIDREGNILALRPEFTSLLAKTVATRLASSPK